MIMPCNNVGGTQCRGETESESESESESGSESEIEGESESESESLKEKVHRVPFVALLTLPLGLVF
jgi:hypothetical protein